MASSIPVITAPTDNILELQFQDFRGQKFSRRYQVKGTLADTYVTGLVDGYELLTNCYITKAQLLTVRSITGMRGAAINALERNESEQMELAFVSQDRVSKKVVTKTVIIPALIAAIETLDGSPDLTNVNLQTFITNMGNAMVFQEVDGNINSLGMVFMASESHHITTADKVDTV